jgi:Zn-dependent protease/predicted transcriptional regulator
MTRQSIPLGRIIGIPIALDYSWFLVFALLTWMLAVNYYPQEFKGWPESLYWIVGAVTAIMLFVSVLLHELGHSVIALGYKVPVRRITLFIFGGVAEIGGEPPSASAEFFIAIAGPIVSLILGVIFYLVQRATAQIPAIYALSEYLSYINFALVVFNAIPGFPLDGGRVFRAIVWGITHDMARATYIAATVGRAFAFLFIFFGVFQIFTGHFANGLWIAFIGWFLDHAASAQLHQVAFQRLLGGHKVSEVMNPHYPVVAPDVTLQQLVDEHILGAGKRSFVVGDDQHPLGLMTLHRVKEVPRDQWPATSAAQVTIPLASVKRVTPDSKVWTAMQQMDRDGVNQLVVMTDGHIVGILSREDVISYLRGLQELNV